jgi:hypothetical protein
MGRENIRPFYDLPKYYKHVQTIWYTKLDTFTKQDIHNPILWPLCKIIKLMCMIWMYVYVRVV